MADDGKLDGKRELEIVRGIALAIVLIVLATRGGGPKPPPADAGQLALQQADAYAKQHPRDHDGAIARYEGVASQHGGSRWPAVEEGLRPKIGDFLAFGGQDGTITAVKDGQVSLKTPKGEVTLPIVKLGAKQALTYVLLKDDPRSRVRAIRLRRLP